MVQQPISEGTKLVRFAFTVTGAEDEHRIVSTLTKAISALALATIALSSATRVKAGVDVLRAAPITLAALGGAAGGIGLPLIIALAAGAGLITTFMSVSATEKDKYRV